MEITHSKNPNFEFYIKTDYYPYTESKEIIKTLDYWWEHPTRNIKDIDIEKGTNYSLDSSQPNTLGYSFENKLQNGSFSFVYNNRDEIILYSGLLVVGKDSYVHRLTSNPYLYQEYLGIGGGTIVPFQAKESYDMGLDTYNITFDEHRYVMYKWHRDRLWEKRSLGFKYPECGKVMSNFEFKGKQTLFHTEQYVCTLDLKRPDVNDFFVF
jgi:hypothetical protein